MSQIDNVAVIGVGTVASQRKPGPEVSTPRLLAQALQLALADAGLGTADVDGLGVGSFSLRPDRAVDLAWRLGVGLDWLMEDVLTMNLVAHAARAIEAGDASVVAIVAGDHLMGADYGAMTDEYNVATRDLLSPLPAGGANALLSLVTQEHMARHGLGREAYGQVVVSQRAWAGTNPNAAYRGPLTLDEYLAAPLVADPLTIFDCPPIVAGAEALILAAPERSARGRRRVRVRAVASSFNHDGHEGDGLRTGLAEIAPRLWNAAAIEPADADVVELYDDYPVIVLCQLEDLGLIADGDASALMTGPSSPQPRPAVNTGGGMLTAGQAGAGAGLQGIVEAARQLRHERGEGQVPDARIAVAAGYGMVLYRYGACSVAAVLEGMDG